MEYEEINTNKILEVLGKIYSNRIDRDPLLYNSNRFRFLSTDINNDFDSSQKEEMIDVYCKTSETNDSKILAIRKNIIEQIEMNNLAFYVYINHIRYDFLFTKDNITMLDYSTKNSLSIGYNDEKIISFVFGIGGASENNLIFRKNRNGLSICNVMLKNIYNTTADKQYLIGKFQIDLSRYNLKPEEPFIKAICESGNNIDIFKFILLNKYLDKYDFNSLFNILAAAYFGGNAEMIHILEKKIGNIYGLDNDLKFNIIKQICAGNDCVMAECYCENFFEYSQDFENYLFSENGEKVIELFEVIKDPAIAIFLLEETKSKGLNNNDFLNKIFFNSTIGGHAEVVRLLLKLPYIIQPLFPEEIIIDVNLKNRCMATPLHYAVENGYLEIVQLLLSQPGIEINARDNYGHIPLISAVERGHTEIVRLLLSQPGIDVKVKDIFGDTLIFMAAENGHVEIFQLLFSHPNIDINAKNCSGNTLLFWAVRNRDLKMVQLLLSRSDIDVNVKNNKGDTALFGAAENGHIKIFQLLLSRSDIDVNVKDNFRNTLIFRAANDGCVKIFQLLFLHPNIDINAKNSFGNTLLFWAVGNRNLKMVQLLLSHPGIDVNAKDNYGDTALHCAAKNGHLEIFKLLFSHPNIDINAKNNLGSTPLHFAAGNGYLEIVQLLLPQPSIEINAINNKVDTPLILAAGNGCTKIVQLLLLQPNIEINAGNNDGNTAFHRAAENGHLEVVQLLLLQPDIKINAINNKKDTALILAVRYGYEEIKYKYNKYIQTDYKILYRYIEVIKLLLLNENLETIENGRTMILIEIMAQQSEKVKKGLDAYIKREELKQQNAFVDNLKSVNNNMDKHNKCQIF